MNQVGRNYIVFLEQACDMLKAIGHNLPRYHERLNTCKPQLPAAQHEWIVLLSYAYADLVQFFLELYLLFARNSRGMYCTRVYYVQFSLRVEVGLRSSVGTSTCEPWMSATHRNFQKTGSVGLVSRYIVAQKHQAAFFGIAAFHVPALTLCRG